ncbi:uncharacterized protein LOC110455334 [Mizuhopecten yessoensis]|uniref:uncharacterized protein LOC110455334 n=1 Tax=Mizuhopecten yessoensis TaxID=6573 RepID=UPI000B45C300|nr:uncharacterized protein LOC110455334 [Mizuhopecten yessoensis]
MGTMFKAMGFVIYLVLSLVTCRRIDGVQSRIQTVLISDISPGDDDDQQHRTERQKESLFSPLHNLVRNSFDGVDDDDLPQLYVMCQFDFILWKCERLSSRRGYQQITDQNQQPETDHDTQPEKNQNIQPITDESKQLKIDHNVQPETDQNVQTTTDQSKQLETDHSVQPETDQNVQTTTDQIKQLETYHNLRLKSDKDIQPTTEKPMQHESFNKKDSEIDWNLSLSVEEYEMKEEGADPVDMGLAGSLLCQICSSVKSTAEREKCEIRFCDY